ncbi:restriction endonuclease subunit S [Marinobacter lutaoensis]|uniref:restriction endonuclease subunit S n=1 Tax=Marinobacter lutaoensis TaxID=135739 RepID=UPI001592BF00|nr:restriction endonuclease subunit S [Marinobacter lutaoensis]NVD34995.1 restriction endonuclease subunit S [Marinobacter lutaoensis]
MSADLFMVRLEQLGQIVTGKTPPKSVEDAYDCHGIPFITPKDMDGRKRIDTTERYLSDSGLGAVKRSLVPRNSVAVSCIGSDMGKAVLVDRDSVTNQQINTILIDQERWNPEYIYYLLSTKQQLLKDIAGGSATPILNKGHFGKVEIAVPSKEIQDEAARILGAFDEKIRLNHQINQTLEQMAQAIFKSWFVDFEPVKAKIAALGAGGSEEDALLAAMQAISGKDAGQLARMQAEQPEQYAELRATAELFPSAMQDAAQGSANAAGGRMPGAASELGEIPEGWEVSQIGNEVTVVGGGTPSTKNPDFWEGGDIHWTTPKDLSNLSDKVLLDTERKITHAGLAKISSGLLPIDTVLMSSRAPVGYLALAKTPVAVNQGYIAMKCEGRLSPEFVIQWCSANMPEIKGRASGTTFAEISKKNFKIIPVIVPAKSLVSAYTASVKLLYDAIEVKVRESMNLAQLRDTLLPKLLSGELTLPGTEEPQTESQDAAHG